ncbi:hypothetical protein EDEG_00443 [Edhazardia aedis USNM 41457]|uniref:Uncharacterized protein n=1 Tax=Edhazardia aedis (strain USNM 41457) TaxID=1003232 RepID=J9D0P3_EDHAE|nr:hypothetical protein EDEG_00443 [Edhazardia aedis USNM 41457]|eukprot:EJW01451.1 hypothetical protein EDEG_00443 [Edhazardia aedis USNM 41457]
MRILLKLHLFLLLISSQPCERMYENDEIEKTFYFPLLFLMKYHDETADSKSFVDKPFRKDFHVVISNFSDLVDNIDKLSSKQDLKECIEKHQKKIADVCCFVFSRIL